MIFDKTIEFFMKVFKIMHFNSACAIIVDNVQRIINVTLYKQLIILFVTTLIDARQMTIQVISITAFNSKNCYNCVKSEYKINNCLKINQLMNNDLIHFNEKRKMCFDRIDQKKAEMRL